MVSLGEMKDSFKKNKFERKKKKKKGHMEEELGS